MSFSDIGLCLGVLILLVGLGWWDDRRWFKKNGTHGFY